MRFIFLLSAYLLPFVALQSAERALLWGELPPGHRFERILLENGAEVERGQGDINQLVSRELEDYQMLVLTAAFSPEPLRLSTELSEKLLRYLKNGGRVYLEYATIPEGIWPGWKFAEQSVIAQPERIVAKIDHPAGSTLVQDTLLEEFNSRVLPVQLPHDAQTELYYSTCFGTYKLARDEKFNPEENTYITTVDLGREYSLSSVQQAFGGKTPNYTPVEVTLEIAGENLNFKPVETLTGNALELALFPLASDGVRYVRLTARSEFIRGKRDFIAIHSVIALDKQGENVALGKSYTFKRGIIEQKFASGFLTDGKEPESWNKRQCILTAVLPGMSLGKEKFPALATWPVGKGKLLYGATPISAAETLQYPLKKNWEELERGIITSLWPDAEQPTLMEKALRLQVAPSPRRWELPEKTVRFALSATPGFNLAITEDGKTLWQGKAGADGKAAAYLKLTTGDHLLDITVSDGDRRYSIQEPYTVAARKEFYRRALDRNMNWFLQSGILPEPDGTMGVKNTLDLSSLHSGVAEDIAPFRNDCQAMTSRAFYLYGELADSPQWRTRAENLAAFLIQNQIADPQSVYFGTFPFTIGKKIGFFQDDNSRIAEFLCWLYRKTGKDEYLKPALRTIEFMRDTARNDGTVIWWTHSYRPEGSFRHFEMREKFLHVQVLYLSFERYRMAYLATGLPEYRKAMLNLLQIYGKAAGGFDQLSYYLLPLAISVLPEQDPLRDEMRKNYDSYVKNRLASAANQTYPWPVQTKDISPSATERAYSNDSDIHTFNGEAITDQLYTTSAAARQAANALVLAGDDNSRKLTEEVLDYLVRIQMENRDVRLDGAWLRAFDMDNWEYYGTRYDPNYGAYHAYSGWMNSYIAEALTLYLINAETFADNAARHIRAVKVMSEVLSEYDYDYRREQNRLLNVVLHADIAPNDGSKSTTTMTDGIYEGYGDASRASIWTVPADGLTVNLTGEFPDTTKISRLFLRSGNFDPKSAVDEIAVFGRDTLESSETLIFQSKLQNPDGIHCFEFPEKEFRFFRLQFRKNSEGKLILGEFELTEVCK